MSDQLPPTNHILIRFEQITNELLEWIANMNKKEEARDTCYEQSKCPRCGKEKTEGKFEICCM